VSGIPGYLVLQLSSGLKLWKPLQKLFSAVSGDRTSLATPVVALIRDGRDRDLLELIGIRDHLAIHFADTCDEARSAANRLQSPVVLCARDVAGIQWQDAVRILASANPRPCVILTSPVTDSYMWKEIVERGGYDVLATPLRDADATRSMRLALSYWKSTAGSRQPSRQPAIRK
jgi:DNA-binding NtrC family response regulator